MSRRSYLQCSALIIDARLGLQDPKISRQGTNLLSSCIQVRAKLQEYTDNMTAEERDSFQAVASWDFYGTFSQDDISRMVKDTEGSANGNGRRNVVFGDRK